MRLSDRFALGLITIKTQNRLIWPA